MNKRSYVIVIAILSAISCSGTRTVFPVSVGEVPVFDQTSHGVLVSSSSFSGGYRKSKNGGTDSSIVPWRCDHYSLLYRGTEATTEAFVGDLSAIPTNGSRWSDSEPHAFSVTEGLGFIQATILPAGKYEVWFYNMNCNRINFYSDDFSIPFEVHAGKLNYVGEVEYVHRFRTNFAGLTITDGVVISLENALARDQELIRRKHQFLKDLPIRRVPIDW